MIRRFIIPVALVAALLMSYVLRGQCLVYPLRFDERVSAAQSILLGSVTEQHCYADEKGNIYTLNKVAVDAWIKDHRPAAEAYVITLGGVFNGKAQVSYPAVHLQTGSRYLLMLEKNNMIADDKNIRGTQPSVIQAFPYADAQGAWIYSDNSYHDVFSAPLTEQALLEKFAAIGLLAKRPDGATYTARANVMREGKASDVTSFSPNPTNAGTVNPADYLTINGSGFGSTPGTVDFANADNGGSSFISPPNASDYISWTDNQIVVKVPTGSSNNAGTGLFRVNTPGGISYISPQPLVVGYSHISINSAFSGFAVATRQRYYLRNLDGLGGYTFQYNNNFVANGPAVAAFERALDTWKCNTGINWRASGTTSTVYADDNTNTVLFDASLPAGVLARATSRFSGSAIPGSCDMENTVWWLKEIDVQVRETGVTWQYGPAAATGSQYDFETVVLHELGHAHGLGHRIAPGQLMNYALSNATNIRTPAPVEIQGAQVKVAYSTTPTCFNPTNSGTPMIAAAPCSMPLHLLSFTGEIRSYGAVLNWRTENEVNTDRFEVQRGTDGSAFTTIGDVRSKGNGVNKADYTYTDAGIQPGIDHYRLKMIDKDGSFVYSPVITLKQEGAVKLVSVHPNPAMNTLQVISGVTARLQLTDAGGRVVRNITVAPGSNSIDIANVSNGIYYLRGIDARIRIMIMH